tara:strand:+ start:115 stop:468 length:354 start_codon:yes stop_codon:yes gene_type:complete
MLTSAISKKNNSSKPRKEAREKEEKEVKLDRLLEELNERDPMAYWIKIQDDERMKTVYVPDQNQCKFADCKKYGFYYNSGANFCLECKRQQNSAWLVADSERFAKDPSEFESRDDYL